MTYISQQRQTLEERIFAYEGVIKLTKNELSLLEPNHQCLLKHWNNHKSYKSIINYHGRRLVTVSNEWRKYEFPMPFRIPIFEDDDIKIVKTIYKSVKRKCDRLKSINDRGRYILTSSLTLFEAAISNYLTREIILDEGIRFSILLNQLPRIDDVEDRKLSIKASMPNTVFEEIEDTIFLVETTEDDHVFWALNGGSEVPCSFLRK